MQESSVITGIDDKEILHDYITKAEPLLLTSKANESTLSDIFRNAANELAKYCQDITTVCSRLCRIWKEKDRLIRKALPEEYKRAHSEDLVLADQKLEDVRHAFLHSKELLVKLLKITNKIITETTVHPYIQYKILNGQELGPAQQKEYDGVIQSRQEIADLFGTSSEVDSFTKEVDEMLAEADLIAEEIDKRLQLDLYRRSMLRIFNLILRYRGVGKLFHKSSKWIKYINEDPKLTKLIEKADSCPDCGFNLSRFLRKQNKRVARGLDPNMPAGFVMNPERFIYLT